MVMFEAMKLSLLRPNGGDKLHLYRNVTICSTSAMQAGLSGMGSPLRLRCQEGKYSHLLVPIRKANEAATGFLISPLGKG